MPEEKHERTTIPSSQIEDEEPGVEKVPDPRPRWEQDAEMVDGDQVTDMPEGTRMVQRPEMIQG